MNLREHPVFIVGCTGCGKGKVGRELARRLGGEIVSLDSMKVYRRMDIGTAKPPPEIRTQIPHHLIDVVDPWDEFSAARYAELARKALGGIRERGRPAFVVGGTVLYLKALIQGFFEGPGADPEVRSFLLAAAQAQGTPAMHDRLRRVDPVAAARIHPNDLKRIVRALEVFQLTGTPISALQTQWDAKGATDQFRIIGLRRGREDLNHRINARVRRMMELGLVEEVEALLAEPRPLSRTARQALGYAEIIAHLSGESSLADTLERIKINTRRFAKAQRTWLRRLPNVCWVDVAPHAPWEAVADACAAKMETAWSR